MALSPPSDRPTSPYLAALSRRAIELAALLAGAADDGPRRELVAERHAAAVIATLVLDGAPAEALPSLAAARAEPAPELATSSPAGGPDPDEERRGTWLDALPGVAGRGPDATQLQRLRAAEVRGADAGLASDDLGAALLQAPLDALRELHGRLVAGLVAPERVGALRRGDRTVQDGRVGRVLFYPSAPATIRTDLDALATWITTYAAVEDPLVAAGVVHLELLRIQPYDAANGRLARAAARLLLRCGGLDPHGLVAPEPELARDPLGYHEEVAATGRRRDATLWLERWAEAVVAGGRQAARTLHLVPAASAELAAAVTRLGSPGFTVAEHRASVGVDAAAADDHLAALLDAGLVRPVPGARGLRYVVVEGTAH